MAVSPPLCNFGLLAPDFKLPGTDGRDWTLTAAAGPRGVLVMFICNHCPYVQSVVDRIIRDARELKSLGVGVVAISCNDPVAYPEDGFDQMRQLARKLDFPFPYLFDETQDLADALYLAGPTWSVDINDVLLNSLGVVIGYSVIRLTGTLYAAMVGRLPVARGPWAHFHDTLVRRAI